MNYLYIGKIVNTHGLKGEVRIISDIQEKDKIFQKNHFLYIGDNYDKECINTYRVHKNYDMVTFVDIDNIDDVLKYKGKKVYINHDEYKDIMFEVDYIGFDVYMDSYIGKIVNVEKGYQDLFVVERNDKKYLVPNVKELIDSVDIQNNKITFKKVKGLFDEN